MGAAGAGAPSTGAKRRRGKVRGRRRETEADRKGGRERRKRRERERHGARPVGDPTLQRGKVVAYTQVSRPRAQAGTRTHIKITQTGKKDRKITSALRG